MFESNFGSYASAFTLQKGRQHLGNQHNSVHDAFFSACGKLKYLFPGCLRGVFNNIMVERSLNVFTGPVFLVGMPRCGTKLLRGLLSQRSKIGIPPVETDFFPYWSAYWKEFGMLSDPATFHSFYTSQLRLTYFIDMHDAGLLIDEITWFKKCRDFSLQAVFEVLLRHDGQADHPQMIWGDKSPSYIENIPLIKELYPQAKIIHIVRDVRDYCLSIKKIWGKNMLRAAQRWVDNLNKARADGKAFPDDFLEIRYEDLLENPRRELEMICRFLGVEFEASMLRLSKSYERDGDAKGKMEIIKNNKNKYLESMKQDMRRKINAIAGATLKRYGYDIKYPRKNIRLKKYHMFL